MTQKWIKVAEPDELPEGRVKTVTCELETVCLTHFKGQYGALLNACPHQGGPLGEGSIEGGLLRCPWHGWDFDPLTGKPPGGYDDGVPTFPIDVRPDGVYVRFTAEEVRPRTATDVMVGTMIEWGVDVVFGMVGHSNLGLADALRLAETDGDLTYYGIRHEGAAAFAASAYGKLTGRPAACFSIAGPGATNLLTGLWDAHVDRAPVLALTGQIPTQLIGRGAFQEVDLVGAFGDVAQFRAAIAHDSNFAEIMTLACKSAIVNRGVSHLVFPDDVQTVESSQEADTPAGRLPAQSIRPPDESLALAAEKIAAAKRPLIICGHGARFDMPEILELAEALRCPVATTFKAKGVLPDAHPHACGVLGRSGTPIASWFMNECDQLIVLGASFSNHTGITPKKPIIQVDFDPMQLGRFHKVEVPVWGEIGATVAGLRQRLHGAPDARVDQTKELSERWKLWRTEKLRRTQEERGQGVSSASLFAALTRRCPKSAIITIDVGNHAYSFGRYFECQDNAILMSGYLGSIGFAFPAAMGAWAATQGRDPRFAKRPVVSISGDGGFGQYMAEVNTAVKYGMNITHVLLNNGELGKISKEQRAAHWHVWQTSLSNPSFAAYAEACGAKGIRVTDSAELDSALSQGFDHAGPCIVEVMGDAALI